MLNYVRKFIEIMIAFHTLYIWNEEGDPHVFFALLAQVTHYLTAVKILKTSIEWKMFARTSLNMAWSLQIKINKTTENISVKRFQLQEVPRKEKYFLHCKDTAAW